MAAKQPRQAGEFDKDIEAEVTKHKQKLVFIGFFLVMALIGYIVKIEEATPPVPEPSIECSKIEGAVWYPSSHDAKGYGVEAYCDRPTLVPTRPPAPPPPAK